MRTINQECASQSSYFSSLCSTALNIGKYIFAPFCGIGCALLDLYDIYEVATTPQTKQRKTKIITSLISFLGNVIYAAGAIAGFLNPVGLAALAFGSALPAVYKDSYSTHVVNDNVNRERRSRRNSDTLRNLQEEQFQNKCNVAYKTVKLVGNGFLFGGFFFPPLAIVGGIVLGAATLLESYDQKNDYRFSKAVCHYAKTAWNGICSFCSWIIGRETTATLSATPMPASIPMISIQRPASTSFVRETLKKNHQENKRVKQSEQKTLAPGLKKLVEQRIQGMQQRTPHLSRLATPISKPSSKIAPYRKMQP